MVGALKTHVPGSGFDQWSTNRSSKIETNRDIAVTISSNVGRRRHDSFLLHICCELVSTAYCRIGLKTHRGQYSRT